MAVRIRLKRVGRRHRAAYRVAAIDGRCSRDSKVIEELGTYDPVDPKPEKQVLLRRDRVEYWLGVGAQPSPTVATLLKKQGIDAAAVRKEHGARK